MVSPWPFLVVLALSVGLSSAVEGSCSVGISEATCRALCQYPSSPVVALCDKCYKDVCADVEVTPAPAALAAAGSAHFSRLTARVIDYSNDPGCRDGHGVQRPVFSTWYDNDDYPCVVYTCNPNGRVETVDLGAGCQPPPTHLGECTRHRELGQCCYNYTCTIPIDPPQADPCVDANNIPRQHGQTWQDDPIYPCVTYACSNGAVSIVQDLRPRCPLPPQEQSCTRYRERFQCCYSFNCTVLIGLHPCRDATGQLRPHAAIWYDDITYPCVKYVCNNGTTTTIIDKRNECEAPPSDTGCSAQRAPGECCHTYTCGCTYNGQQYAEGQEFQDDPDHPCALLRCVSGQVIQVTNRQCPELPCSNQIWPIGQCCRQCAPCVFNGQEYHNGAVWFDDPSRPCIQYQCENGFARVIQNTTCDPAPFSGCTEWYMEGICCPKWDCVDAPCVHNGVTRDHGTTWPEDPLKPCRFFKCNNSVVSVASEAPPCPGPPAPHCVPRDVDYQCCPAYDCVTIQCTYNGQNYTEGQTWVDDPSYPCKRFRCTREGPVKIEDRTTSCPPLNPPDCPSQRRLGECCKECITSDDTFCIDENGVEHDVDTTYFEDPATQCRLLRCVGHNTTVLVYDRSSNCGPDPSQTNPACVVTGVVDCCPVYRCPNCTYGGQVYPPGAKWWDDDQRQCTRYMCMEDGQQTIVFTRLPCPSVPTGCVANHRDSDCCHYKYTCMYDPQHNLIPMT